MDQFTNYLWDVQGLRSFINQPRSDFLHSFVSDLCGLSVCLHAVSLLVILGGVASNQQWWVQTEITWLKRAHLLLIFVFFMVSKRRGWIRTQFGLVKVITNDLFLFILLQKSKVFCVSSWKTHLSEVKELNLHVGSRNIWSSLLLLVWHTDKQRGLFKN